jgi:hypothetical protein
MTSAFDQRIIKVGIEIDGNMLEFEGLNIYARGTKWTSASMSACEVRIFNLTQEQRKFILTQASPIARPPALLTPINLTLDVGRESYGTFRLFEGQVFQGGVTQPPDIGIVLSSLTNNYQLSMTQNYQQSSIATVKTIAQQIADAMKPKLALEFDPAADKQIENFSYTGSPQGMIAKLNQMGGVIAHIDNRTLVVSAATSARGTSVRILNQANGMVGIPQPTAGGCIVKMMLDNSIQIGGEVQVESIINPGVNGNYIVRQMDFDIASRDTPFWYTLQCQSKQLYTGGTQ